MIRKEKNKIKKGDKMAKKSGDPKNQKNQNQDNNVAGQIGEADNQAKPNIEEEKVKQDKVIDFEQKKSEKEANEDELGKAQKEIKELESTVKRTQADFMNFKRRTEEDKEKVKAFANENIIMDLLEVIDNFDRALEQENNTDASFLEGVALIRKQILDILEKNQVKEIETEQGFDPHLHYAVMQEEGEEPDQILQVLQKGYTLKDKVIRPSMVKVSK